MNETTITVIGNITDDPELRFTPSGAAVANFTVASTPRKFDKASNEFKDGETSFYRVAVWRAAAENVAESLRKGMRVIVHGEMVLRPFEDRDGNKRISPEINAFEVGASLQFATANITRASRTGGQQAGGQQGQPQQQGGQPQGQPQQGGQQGGYGGQDPWGPPQSDEPPF